MNYNEEMYKLFKELGIDKGVEFRKLNESEKATQADWNNLEERINIRNAEIERMLDLSKIYEEKKEYKKVKVKK